MKNKLKPSEFKGAGLNLLAYSSGGDMLVKSFKAKKGNKIIFGWWDEKKNEYDLN